MNAWCATLLNLESKFFKYTKSIYFCSKYFVHDNNNWFIVPDPVKLLVKLGRSDLVNFEHVEEYRTSLMDLTEVYKYFNIVKMLDTAINERYKIFINTEMFISTLRSVIMNKDLFASLYYFLPGDNICNDPSRKKL